ncbi:MAG TPA: serine/threonine-protein kinase, partial [Planctomycetota bacterium]|nr:serine/threonine-protein kinase [Planctomycetota bacterium]
MTDDRARKVLEKALARGLITAGTAHETMRRLVDAEASGARADVIEVLREVGQLDERAVAGLDDRSLIGRTLGGFKVEAKLGEGGMGAVYRATQISLGRSVGLKILDPSLAVRPDVATRFKREARAAARLDHPHVVQPIDFGEDAGFLFFAMELMEGGSAAGRITRGQRYSEVEAVEVGIGIARALDYASEQGIVHRDLKPDN